MRRRDFIAICVAAKARATTARDESLARVVERFMASAGCDYVLGSIAGRAPILASRWPGLANPAPMGSLVKPFLTLAYAEAHNNHFPEWTCRPGQCWYLPGHGSVNVEYAIAHSCNTYFMHLARNVSLDVVETVVERFGLSIPQHATPEMLIGREGAWRATPAAMANAYAELAARQGDGTATIAMNGMRLCAREGTASAAHAHMAAKTGTAKCIHARAAAGDGLMAALFPEIVPEFVLIVRGHGMPGAETARRMAPFFHALKYDR